MKTKNLNFRRMTDERNGKLNQSEEAAALSTWLVVNHLHQSPMKILGNHLLPVFIFLIVQAGLLSSWQQLSFLLSECGDNTDRSSGAPTLQSPHSLPRRTNSPSRNSSSSIDRTVYTKDGEEQFLNGVVIRAFPSWPENLPLPCGRAHPKMWWHPLQTRAPAKKGYLFVKEMKTGSSTVAGIVLRIARNVAKRENKNFTCLSRFDHSAARDMGYYERDTEKSFLFTVIRNPQTRLASQFFHFFVSRRKMEPNDKNFQGSFKEMPYMQDYYLRDLALIPSGEKEKNTFIHRYSPSRIGRVDPEALKTLRLGLANGIMRGYDFIGITERMDESLVVMMMLLRLKISDILYIKAKSSGGFDDGAFNNTCTYIVPAFTSPGMKSYFQSDHYGHRSLGDWILYRAANKSLDMTIDQLGPSKVEEHLKQFRAAQKVANEKCASGIRYPCSASGVRQPYRTHFSEHTDCLWLDSACGYKCLDALEPEIESMLEQGEY
jgi:hypothetical protein